MSKSVYFIIQIVWSLILSTGVWYLSLMNASFDFYGNSNDSLMGVFLIIGAALYLILTIVQIVVGIKKIKDWRWWVILVSLLIAVAVAFIGAFVAIYGSEFLNKLF